MFKDAGKKIKGIAKGMFVLLCVFGFLAGCVIIKESVAGFIIWIVTPIVAWVFSLFLYGFGEIVDAAIAAKKEEAEPSSTVRRESSVLRRADMDTEEEKLVKNRICPDCKKQLIASEMRELWICPDCRTKYRLKGTPFERLVDKFM